MAKPQQSTIEQALQQNTQILAAWRTWFTATIRTGDPDTALRKLQPALWRAFCRSKEAQQLGISLPPYDASTRQSEPVPQPQPQPDPIPQPQPQPQPDPIPQPVPSVSSNPLLDAIAQGLKDMGFTPAAPQACPSLSDIDTLVQEAVTSAMAQYQTAQHTIVIKKQDTAPVTVSGQAPKWFNRLVRLHAARVPALLVGPAGSGKTTAAALLAEAVGVPFYRVSLAAGTDEGELTGRLLPVKEHMQFDFVASLFVKGYTEGGVVLADDIDLADANMLGLLNAALDTGGWHIASRYQDPVLVRHDDFYLVAAANTHGHGADRQYVGAQQLDERTLSRFRLGQINCDYDADLERQLFPTDVVEIGHRIRTRCRAIPGWNHDVSTRDLASVTKLCGQLDLGEAWYGYFADWTSQDCDKLHVLVDHNAMCVEIL